MNLKRIIFFNKNIFADSNIGLICQGEFFRGFHD